MRKVFLTVVLVLFAMAAVTAQAQSWKYVITKIDLDTTNVGTDSVSGSFDLIIQVEYYDTLDTDTKYPRNFQFGRGITKDGALAKIRSVGADIKAGLARHNGIKGNEGDTLNVPDN